MATRSLLSLLLASSNSLESMLILQALPGAESEDVDIHLLVGQNILQSSQKNESDPLFFQCLFPFRTLIFVNHSPCTYFQEIMWNNLGRKIVLKLAQNAKTLFICKRSLCRRAVARLQYKIKPYTHVIQKCKVTRCNKFENQKKIRNR